MEAAIVATELSKIFEIDGKRTVAVDNINFEIQPGKIIGLLGPNGAGKTTTIRLIASLISPTAGNSFVNGKNSVKNSIDVRSMIGLSHEKPSFYRGLTGRRNLRFYGELYDVPKELLQERINNLAEEFDLTDAIDQPVGSYSKGMTQKLSICKALINDAPVLIFDEPWSGLSPGAARDLRRKIKSLGQSLGRTILITTHNLAQAELVVDELMIISKGQLIASGTPLQLREQYHINPELKISLANKLTMSVDTLLDLDYIADITMDDDQKNILIKITNFEYTPQLVSLLVKNQQEIREVKEQIPSLEDIYLQLVEVDK